MVKTIRKFAASWVEDELKRPRNNISEVMEMLYVISPD